MEHVSLQMFLFDKSITGPSQKKRSSFIEGGIALHFLYFILGFQAILCIFIVTRSRA